MSSEEQRPVPLSLENLRKMIEKIQTEPEQEYQAHGVFYEQGGKILFIGTESRGIPTLIREAYTGWQDDFRKSALEL